MPVRRVFYSFHYLPDGWRVSQVRNIGALEDNKPATDNDWESVKGGGDSAIKRWIDGQLLGRTCTIVLIGENTANRKWINYEIQSSWAAGKGVLGIHIHNLKNHAGQQSTKGLNPFSYVSVGGKRLSDTVKTYDPPYTTSTYVHDHIVENLAGWVEAAIKIRANA